MSQGLVSQYMYCSSQRALRHLRADSITSEYTSAPRPAFPGSLLFGAGDTKCPRDPEQDVRRREHEESCRAYGFPLHCDYPLCLTPHAFSLLPLQCWRCTNTFSGKRNAFSFTKQVLLKGKTRTLVVVGTRLVKAVSTPAQ